MLRPRSPGDERGELVPGGHFESPTSAISRQRSYQTELPRRMCEGDRTIAASKTKQFRRWRKHNGSALGSRGKWFRKPETTACGDRTSEIIPAPARAGTVGISGFLD